MTNDLPFLLRLAEQSGDDAVLDELVHETAQELSISALNELAGPAQQEEHISTIETLASDINNGGFERQIEYLLRVGVSRQTIEVALRGGASDKSP